MSQLKVNSIVPTGGLPSGALGRIIQIKYTPVNQIISQSTNETGSNFSAFDTLITPTSANSRFLITAYLNVASAGGNTFGVMVRRNNSVIDELRADADGNRRRYTGRGATSWNADGNHMHNYTVVVLDTPSTTNNITYKLFFATEGSNTLYINRNRNNSNSTNPIYSRGMSSMTVMEVDGQ